MNLRNQAFIFLLCLFFLSFTNNGNQKTSGGVREAWVRYFGANKVLGEDVVVANAVDQAGNVYITGYSPTVPNGYDYYTIKLNPLGLKIWSAKYNGPGNGDDIPVGMVLDDGGNVYVTGTSYVSKTNTDFATVKYNASGKEQWVARYNSPDDLLDEAKAVAVDGKGNVFVTGKSDTVYRMNQRTCVTIKYDALGREQWVKRYRGLDNIQADGVAIDLDARGNVYVAGTSNRNPNDNFFSDFMTIKYATTGEQEWVRRFNADQPFANAVAVALVVDAVGNVGVTGTLREGAGLVTVKYNTRGEQRWSASYYKPLYNIPTELAFDQVGNLYVTGRSGSDGNYDFVTIKYDSIGVEKWAARYVGPFASFDRASALGVDVSGNVYVTGTSTGNACTVVKYDAAGVEQWAIRSALPGSGYPESKPDLAIDPAGNVHIATTTTGAPEGRNRNYLAIKYNPTGAEQWSAQLDEGRSTDEYANATFVDAAGNTYVAGYSIGLGVVIVKYNSAGTSRILLPGAATIDHVTSLFVDASGNIYLAGYTSIENLPPDYLTAKFDADGRLLWQARYNGVGNGADEATAIAVDVLGNVYVTGASKGQATSRDDHVTIKYNSNGVEQWVARNTKERFDSFHFPPRIALDASGNIHIASNAATIKYDASGNERWVVRDQPGYAIEVDAKGNVFTVGVDIANKQYITIKRDSSGNKIWEARQEGMLYSNSTSLLAISRMGGVYIAGQAVNPATGSTDFMVVKYSDAGVKRWVAYHLSLTYSESRMSALALDKDDNVYVTGTGPSTTRTSTDFVTVKYNSSGVEQWRISFGSPADAYDQPIGIGLDAAGNVYVAGRSQNTNGGVWRTFTTVKYEQTPNAVVERQSELPTSYRLEQNLPNPFNPSTIIRFDLPQAERVHLAVYNLRGELVATLVDGNLSPGTHAFTFNANGLASGVYFYRVSTEKFSATKKMLLTK